MHVAGKACRSADALANAKAVNPANANAPKSQIKTLEFRAATVTLDGHLAAQDQEFKKFDRYDDDDASEKESD